MSQVSRKILAATTLSVTTIIVMFLSFVEHANYEKSLSSMTEEQRLITEGQAVLLSQYMHDQHDENIYLTLSGTVANPTIVGAVINDGEGHEIFQVGKTESDLRTYTYAHPITYFEDGRVLKLGEIVTYASDTLLVKSFTDRLWSLAIMVVLVVCAIVASVAITVRKVVEKPVNLLARAFSSETESEPAPLSWPKNDEMGLLISQFNKLNSRLHQKVDDLRDELHDNEVMEAERLKCLTDAALEGIIIHRNGTILDANAAICALIGLPHDEVIGRDVRDCIGAESWQDDSTLEANGSAFTQMTIQPAAAPERTVEISSKHINYAGAAACVVAIRDITDRIKSQEKIKFLAHYDHLTHLANRFKFYQDLSAGLSESHFQVRAVLCLDLDGFKSVNDFHGHAAGDELLKQVARRLRDTVRQTDCVARLGGDEFAVALFGKVDAKGAQRLADKIIDALAPTYTVEGNEVKIGVSIGIALCGRNGTNAEDIVKQADLALYEAKHSGKGQHRFYRRHMEVRVRRGMEIERRLRIALQEQSIEVHFQPQAIAKTGEISGFEALARWTDPELGVVQPTEFIAVAEQTGLIRQLGDQVLAKACKTAVEWPSHLRLAVNLSAAEFANTELVGSIKRVLRQTGLHPSRLELEITETALMQDEKLASKAIQQLKELGTTIAIDDFGTGHSSLSLLQRYPFDRIKIDKSFIRTMDLEPEAALIVRSIVNLSHNLKISVIAEGVETEADLRALKMERCDEVQGYFIGRPGPATELSKYVQHTQSAIQQAS